VAAWFFLEWVAELGNGNSGCHGTGVMKNGGPQEEMNFGEIPKHSWKHD
jgi:hypothetical protein